jgi:hypothetical protein
VAFLFKNASCVVVGTFNIYILHPQWLAKHGLVEKGTGVHMETNLAQPGFRFRLPKVHVIWNIAPQQIAVETDDPQVDCGAKISVVLDALPETPLFGLGNNIVYRADLADLGTLPEPIRNFPCVESPDKNDKVVQRTFHFGVKHDEHRSTNLQVSIKDDEIELLCNVHTELRDRDTRTVAVAAANKFFEDRTAAKTLAQHFFGTGIENAFTNG